MDWNKSNNILIVAFLIVNIFLICFIYFSKSADIKNDMRQKEEFLNSVKTILQQKGISVSSEVTNKIYEAPILELEYDIIQPSRELVERFIGNFNGPVNNDTLIYSSDSETIEIESMKKIIYTNTSLDTLEVPNDKLDSSLLSSDEVKKIINDFCKEKDIDLKDFVKILEYSENSIKHVKYVEKYNGYSLENSYIDFSIKKGQVYSCKIQKVARINERANIKSISATEALLRLMTFDDISDKDITSIQICYYTKEDEDFKNKNSISTDLIWKVVFSDNTYAYLVSGELE